MRGALILAALALAAPVSAQSSANYTVEEHVFNAGGHPDQGVVLRSTAYRLSLDSLGDSFGAASLASPSFRAGAGFVAAYPPPSEVDGVLFAGPSVLEWDAERSAGSYSLYRGELEDLADLQFGDCSQTNLTVPTATDGDVPATSAGFYYLVTVHNRLDEEGTKGSQSSGTRREGERCP